MTDDKVIDLLMCLEVLFKYGSPIYWCCGHDQGSKEIRDVVIAYNRLVDPRASVGWPHGNSSVAGCIEDEDWYKETMGDD